MSPFCCAGCSRSYPRTVGECGARPPHCFPTAPGGGPGPVGPSARRFARVRPVPGAAGSSGRRSAVARRGAVAVRAPACRCRVFRVLSRPSGRCRSAAARPPARLARPPPPGWCPPTCRGPRLLLPSAAQSSSCSAWAGAGFGRRGGHFGPGGIRPAHRHVAECAYLYVDHPSTPPCRSVPAGAAGRPARAAPAVGGRIRGDSVSLGLSRRLPPARRCPGGRQGVAAPPTENRPVRRWVTRF